MPNDVRRYGIMESDETPAELIEDANGSVVLYTDYATLQARLDKATKWLPIETAPKDGTWVLLGKKNSSVAGYFDKVSYHWRYGDCQGFIKPTHWLPLPQPPTKEV